MYNAQNLAKTTIYKAVLQNGATCTIDTSSAATIKVDPKSAGGSLSPVNIDICLGQNSGALLTLNGSTGGITNWQSTQDNINWTSFNPAYTSPVYSISGIKGHTEYRVLVKSGVCPADTSSIATVNILQVLFPKAVTAPADTTICYGDTAQLNVLIGIGTNYTWTNTGSLTGQGNGTIPSTPYSINPKAHPLSSTTYQLSIENAGCPNLLTDSFRVQVLTPITVNAGRDTSIVFNQPLQLHATSNDTAEVSFAWTPATGLNNPAISDPVAVLGPSIDSVRYRVKVTSTKGCFGLANILVRVFKTAPDIFVPNAFTPGGPNNSLFRPVPVGISSLTFFRVYNRWGQLVYSTSTVGQGWDGRLNGRLQESGSFVWMVQGTTYTGNTVSKRGTMVLIR
jgi:hypothetical protein